MFIKIKSKSIVRNTYTVRRINFRSKPTTINGPLHKSDLNFSYSRSHFSRLPYSVPKVLSNLLHQKFSYAYMMIDPVINRFSPNEVKIHFHICDNLIITFFTRGLYLEFSNTSRVDSLDRFRKTFLIR